MAYCKAHQLDMHGFCNKFDCPCIKQNCRFFGVKTNADRIRAMSDEELAELFHGFCDNGERCVYCPLYEKSCAGVHSDVPKWLEWLQQPAEGE